MTSVAFQSILRKQIRTLPKFLKSVKIIQYYYSILLNRVLTRLREVPAARGGGGEGLRELGRQRHAGGEAEAALLLGRGGLRALRLRRGFQFLSKFWQNFARFRLYRHRSLQANTRFFSIF